MGKIKKKNQIWCNKSNCYGVNYVFFPTQKNNNDNTKKITFFLPSKNMNKNNIKLQSQENAYT